MGKNKVAGNVAVVAGATSLALLSRLDPSQLQTDLLISSVLGVGTWIGMRALLRNYPDDSKPPKDKSPSHRPSSNGSDSTAPSLNFPEYKPYVPGSWEDWMHKNSAEERQKRGEFP